MEGDIKKGDASASKTTDKTEEVESTKTVEAKVADTNIEEAKKPTEPVVDNQETPKTKKGKSKWFVLGIIVLAIILLGGGGAGAYFGYYKPSQPKAVVKKALSNALVLNKQQSFKITAEFNSLDNDIDLEIDELTIEGGVDKDSNIQADVNVVASGFDINASAIVRLEDQQVFFKIDNLDSMFSAIPDAMSYPDVANFVNTLSDNWIRLSVEDLQDADMITTSQANKAEKCLDSVTGFVKNSSVDLQKQFTSLYDQADFATMNKVSSEKVGGQTMTKYAVVINQARFKTFLQGLGNQLKGSTKGIADACGLDQVMDTSNDDNSTSSDLFGESNGQLKSIFLWIDSNKQIGQLEVTVGDDTLEAVVTATLDNESVDTDAPDDFVTISDILQDPTVSGMLEGMLGGIGSFDSSSSSTDTSNYSDSSEYYSDYLDLLNQ